jgi:hypothetical protein
LVRSAARGKRLFERGKRLRKASRIELPRKSSQKLDNACTKGDGVEKATTLLAMSAAVMMGNVSTVSAQGAPVTDKPGFIVLYGGAQPQRHTFIATGTQSIYDETATVSSEQHIRNGSLIQVGAGYRVQGPLAIGARFSIFGRPGTSHVTAQVPSPAFYNQPDQRERDAEDLAHTERGIHVQAMWMRAVTPRIDVALSAGPSIIRVTQDLTTTFTAPPGTRNIALVKTTEQANAIGFNGGFDGVFALSPGLGVGVFVHYLGATVDLPSAEDVKLGGVQGGLGLHLRF